MDDGIDRSSNHPKIYVHAHQGLDGVIGQSRRFMLRFQDCTYALLRLNTLIATFTSTMSLALRQKVD
jgi:hypothetical protein